MIFDGKKFASQIEKELVESGKIAGKSLLILQCDGSDKESKYVELKRKAGERMGVVVKTQRIKNSKQLEEKLKLNVIPAKAGIYLNRSPIGVGDDDTIRLGMTTEIQDFNGVLVQLPIVGAGKKETEEILGLIPLDKDVDGLNPESKFVPAVVRAVEKILDEIKVTPMNSVAVVGAKGMVGRRLVSSIKYLGFREIGEFDLGDDLKKLRNYWVVISATGQAGLIKPEMVRDGVVAIDLGYPKGDFDPSASSGQVPISEKAKFFTPVPGGVGPVTVVCLYENLALAN